MNNHAYLVTPEGGSPTLVSAESPVCAAFKLATAIEGCPPFPEEVFFVGERWVIGESKFEVQPA
jgi:hypothetical protein